MVRLVTFLKVANGDSRKVSDASEQTMMVKERKGGRTAIRHFTPSRSDGLEDHRVTRNLHVNVCHGTGYQKSVAGSIVFHHVDLQDTCDATDWYRHTCSLDPRTARAYRDVTQARKADNVVKEMYRNMIYHC